MRWISLLKEILRDVIVPLGVAGIAAYSVIRASQLENEDDGDEGKTNAFGASTPRCCCGCHCRRCREHASGLQAAKDSGEDHSMGVLGG